MEQKKTLWIIAAVGVFLLVVLGVPAILHYPSRNPVPAYASISPVEKSKASSGWTKPVADVSAPDKVSDLVVLADNATVYSPNVTSPAQSSSTSADGATTIDLNALKNEIISETLSAVTSERTSRVIDKDGGAASMEKRKREGYF